MEVFKQALQEVLSQIRNNLGLYITIIGTATYHLMFERKFACSCKPQNELTKTCYIHMVLPVPLLWVVLLLLDKGLQRLFFKTDCVWVVMVHVIHSLCVSMIWVASVLVDGDWWLCCQNNGTQIQAKVACTPPSEYTMEEKSISTDLKSQSRNYGLIVLLATAALALFVSFVHPCWKKSNGALAEVILEDGHHLVFDLLQKAAMQSLTEQVQTHVEQREWAKCYKAVENLVNEMTPGNKWCNNGNDDTLQHSGPV